MRKLITLIIVLLLCASAAWAQTEPKKIGGGGTATGTTPATGTGGATGALPATPKPGLQLNALYTKGKEWQVYDAQLPKPPEGYTYAGSFTLNGQNLKLIQTHSGATYELVSMQNNKVAVKNPDGTLDVSVGEETITGWTGPDKFAYSPTALIHATYAGQEIVGGGGVGGKTTSIELKDGTKVITLPGGALQLHKGTIDVYDAKGTKVTSFTEKQWDLWTGKFEAAGMDVTTWLPAAYAIRDLKLDPTKTTAIPEGSRLFTDNAIISVTGNTVTVTQGTIDTTTGTTKGAYTEKTYSLVNGQQSVSHTKEVDSSGKTVSEYTYTDNAWTVSTLNDKKELVTTTIPRVSYDEGKTYYLQLGAVGAVTVVKDPQTGAIKYYGADKKELTGAELDKFLADKDTKEAVNKLKDNEGEAAKKAISNKNTQECPAERCGQFNSFGQFLTRFAQYYNQYAGMAGWSSLIFDEKFLADWREKVNDIMCNKLNLPTKDCWVSKICNHYSDITSPRQGILFTSSAGGAPRAVAHIEATRSLPIITPNATYYAYTVTFSLTNPHDEQMTYNVRFMGKTAPTWWDAAQAIGKSGTANAIGAAALFKVSSREYSEVCLEFDPKIQTVSGFSAPFSGSSRVGKICNSIVQHAGGAEAPYPVLQGNQTTNATGGGAAAAPGAPAPPGASI